MEDRNVLAADCIVISCCCQCMILQILIFILLKLPHKLLKKTKGYVKKLRTRKRAGTKIMQIEMRRYEEDSLRIHGNSFRIEVEEFFSEEPFRIGCCMDEIELVLGDFSNRGAFSFGSFSCGEVSRSFPSLLKEEEIDYEDVRYHLIELFGSSTSLNIHSL